MSATEELLRLRYELHVLHDAWVSHAAHLDEKILEYEETQDHVSAIQTDAAAIRFRYCASQLKAVLDA